MRHFLIFALLLGLVSGCSSVNFGPHRIDVQQGNALDQDNVARLKPGLNRSQVRFLLGTPLVVDPFRSDRWDYVYVNYKAGRLAEQKRLTLYFDGDTLSRIEGDLPPQAPAAETPPATTPAAAHATAPSTAPSPSRTVATPLTSTERAAPAPLPDTSTAASSAAPSPAASNAPASAAATSASGSSVPPAPMPVPTPPDEAVAATASRAAAASPAPAARAAAPSGTSTSVVAPLASPRDATPYVDPRPQAELALQRENNVSRIQPDSIPAFPDADPAAVNKVDEAVLDAVNAWARAWLARDVDAYFGAYDASFVPSDAASRAEWERRRRLQFGASKQLELKIDAPTVERTSDGRATVTFKQFYRADNKRDAVLKQLRLIEREDGWLIVQEKVLSVLPGAAR